MILNYQLCWTIGRCYDTLNAPQIECSQHYLHAHRHTHWHGRPMALHIVNWLEEFTRNFRSCHGGKAVTHCSLSQVAHTHFQVFFKEPSVGQQLIITLPGWMLIFLVLIARLLFRRMFPLMPPWFQLPGENERDMVLHAICRLHAGLATISCFCPIVRTYLTLIIAIVKGVSRGHTLVQRGGQCNVSGGGGHILFTTFCPHSEDRYWPRLPLPPRQLSQ